MVSRRLLSLCGRNGFVLPGQRTTELSEEIAGCWDAVPPVYGPLGVAMKRNMTNEWWEVVSWFQTCLFRGVAGGIPLLPHQTVLYNHWTVQQWPLHVIGCQVSTCGVLINGSLIVNTHCRFVFHCCWLCWLPQTYSALWCRSNWLVSVCYFL